MAQRATSRVTEKGQVTIPKRIRERLGIRAGEVLEFEEQHGGAGAARRRHENPVDELYGVLRDRGRADDLIELLRRVPDAA
jgi:antitoxin PrlF